MTDTATSKTQKLVEAARKRRETEEELEKTKEHDAPRKTGRMVDNLREEEIDNMKEKADIQASVNVQSRAGTIDGDIDPEAMGDVKGDGRDAKDYPDDDPDKHLGIPTWEHGLNQTREGVDVARDAERVHGGRQSKRTQDEMDRGKEVLGAVRDSRRDNDRKSDTRNNRYTTGVADNNDEAERKAKEAKEREEREAKEREEKEQANKKRTNR